jgi:hypothetical protein
VVSWVLSAAWSTSSQARSGTSDPRLNSTIARTIPIRTTATIAKIHQ